MGRLQKQLYQLLSEAGAEQAQAAPADLSAAPLPLACSAGPLTRISPGLRIAGGDALKLPLQAEQAAAIMASNAAQAGRSGRSCVCLVAAAQLEVTNPRWQNEVVAEAVRRAKAALGISPDTAVDARLRQLELRKPCGESKVHSSTAGVEGAFGELAILLPSSHEGGALHVLHGGREVQVDLAARNAKSSCFAAFYSGCLVCTQPLTAGHRCMLVYDLVCIGGPQPPQLPNDSMTRLLSLAQQWSHKNIPAAKFCYMLENRYSASALRDLGVEALQGADKKVAQLLLSACERGAELDVCLALVKASALPGVSRGEIFDKMCEAAGEYRCPDCGGYHMATNEEQGLWAAAEDAFQDVLHHNQGYNAHKRMKWTRVLAGKLVPLAGPQPPFHHTDLDAKSELLCGKNYWRRQPDRVYEDSEDEDEDGPFAKQQFRRAGLLIWPRSKRLLNAVYADVAQQTLRLPRAARHAGERTGIRMCPDDQPAQGCGGGAEARDTLPPVARPTAGAIKALRDARDWLTYSKWLDEDELFEDDASDSCDGFSEGEDSDDEDAWVQPDSSAAELGDAIICHLSDPSLKYRYNGVSSLQVLLQLAPNPQLAGRQPGGSANKRRAVKMLGAAAALSNAAYNSLAPQAAALLKHWRWHPSMLAALQRWARCDPGSHRTSVELLDAIMADSASAPAARKGRALAAASTVALSLAKAMRQGAKSSKRTDMYTAFETPDKIVLALQRVPTGAGQLALESVVESVLERYSAAPLHAQYNWGLDLRRLHKACTAILQAVTPADVAGNAALLKLACSCLSALAAGAGEKPVLPTDWSKPGPAGALVVYIYGPLHNTLRAFLLDAEQREITIAAGHGDVDDWVATRVMAARGMTFEDIRAEKVEAEEGGPASWRLTKRHAAYERACEEYRQRCDMRRSLQDLLLPCLVLALPRGGGGGSSGSSSPSATAAEGKAPPAKAQRR